MRIPKTVRSTVEQGEYVLLDLQSGDFFGLDELGSLIWSMIEQQKTVPEIVEAICSTYDAPEERVTQDVSALIAQFVGKGLVEVT